MKTAALSKKPKKKAEPKSPIRTRMGARNSRTLFCDVGSADHDETRDWCADEARVWVENYAKYLVTSNEAEENDKFCVVCCPECATHFKGIMKKQKFKLEFETNKILVFTVPTQGYDDMYEYLSLEVMPYAKP